MNDSFSHFLSKAECLFKKIIIAYCKKKRRTRNSDNIMLIFYFIRLTIRCLKSILINVWSSYNHFDKIKKNRHLFQQLFYRSLFLVFFNTHAYLVPINIKIPYNLNCSSTSNKSSRNCLYDA